jgi:tetratricopeptide (TPR) repeat protein
LTGRPTDPKASLGVDAAFLTRWDLEFRMTRNGKKKSRRRNSIFRMGMRGVALVALASGVAPAQDLPPLPVPSPSQGPASGDPVTTELELQRGQLDVERGRYEEALKRLERIGGSRPEAAYLRGLSFMGLDRPAEALRQFEIVRSRPAAPVEADLNAGIAELGIGDAPAAETSLSRFLKARPDDPYGHYFLGISKFRQSRFQDASNEFDRASIDKSLIPSISEYRKSLISDFNPSGPGAEPLPPSSGPPVDTMTRLSAPPGGPGTIPGPNTVGVGGDTEGPANPNRRYNLALINGYEYDTNVALSPSIALTGLGAFNRRPDSRYMLASFGEYRLVQRQELVVGLLGSTYDTFQFRLPQFNLQDYMGGIYANAALGKKAILGGRYEFHDTLLAGRQFTTDHRLTPNLTFREGTFGHFTTFYEYENLDVKGLALIPAQRRTGNINAVGATQAVYLANGNGRLYLNYRYEDAQTQGSDFDRSTNQVSARLEMPLPGKMVFNTEFRQFWDDYKHPNSLDFLGRVRMDRRIEVRAGIQKFLTPHLSLRLDYVYTDNHSNVQNLFNSSFYSYNRNTLSTLLVYDF